MKKNILALSIMTLSPAIAAAEDFYTASPNNAKKGVIIVPLSEMSSPETIKSFMQQQKTKGYSLKEFNDVKEMIKSSNLNYANDINNTSDPTDTHMKSDLSKVKLAFKFKNIPFVKPSGYAVGGTYLQNSGWTSISTFFNDKDLGPCEYKLNNMAISQGAVLRPKEYVRYDINNKVTSVFVEGSKNSGFMYNVNWDDDTYNHFLMCANMNFDKAILDGMVNLAKKIDNMNPA